MRPALLILLIMLSPICRTQNVTVASITFEGNKKTQISFLEKIIELEAGKTYDSLEFKRLLDISRSNLANTNLFTVVSSSSMQSASGQGVQVFFSVTERWFIWPIPYAKIHETNFNTWLKNPDLFRLSYGLDLKHYNVAGRVIELELSGRLGYVKAGGFGIKVPFIGRSNWSFKLNANYREYAELVYGTRDNLRLFYRDPQAQRIANETAGTLQAFYNFNFNDYVSIKSRVASFQISDSMSRLNSYFPELNINKELIINHTLITRFDRRDRQSYPLEGWYAHGEINLSSFSSGNSYLNSLVDLRSYQKLSKKWFGGVGFKWQSVSKNAPYYLVQSLGYRNYIRSFEDYVMDGSSTFLFKSDIKYQLVNKAVNLPKFKISHLRKIPYQIYVGAFVDAGYVSSFENNFSNSLQDQILSGFGVGIDFTTIYDRVIRLELAYNDISQLGVFLHFTQAI